MRKTDPRVGFGRGGEAIAEAYLVERGYRLLARRFRLRNGELDLVMEEGPTVVFVEVRTRGSASFGDPLESVGPLKQSRIIRAARVFLGASRLHDRPCRFDVVSVLATGGRPPRIEHRIDAFRADGVRW
jgi:putative endonuclease